MYAKTEVDVYVCAFNVNEVQMPPSKKSAKNLKVSLSTRIDPALRKQLERLAKADKITVSKYVEIALAKHVSDLRD
jgi:predicted HicB family RNase H-like nuclease